MLSIFLSLYYLLCENVLFFVFNKFHNSTIPFCFTLTNLTTNDLSALLNCNDIPPDSHINKIHFDRFKRWYQVEPLIAHFNGTHSPAGVDLNKTQSVHQGNLNG